jgi:two-component sensor histidine kinase
VVPTIARQTAVEGDVAERLNERIRALAASHDLLVRSNWQGVEFVDLVRGQLAHWVGYLGNRIIVEGPANCLKSGAAQALGMALHELAPNAAKYGAFGQTVIVQMVEHALEALVRLDYRPSGLIWELVAPADRAVERA